MADAIFEHPRLVAIYDAFDGKRRDLEAYLAIAMEFEAKSILDVGCGTGNLACLLAARGIEVYAVDPAEASIEAACDKSQAEMVKWICGHTHDLPHFSVDLAVMTGNVAQVFETDASWDENLRAIFSRLRPGGHLVFETRNPADHAWLGWNREKTCQRETIEGIGVVEGYCEVTKVELPFVSFRWTYTFQADGEVLTSDSTLRFRTEPETRLSLERAGFEVREMREAPDRPGKELVFVAQRPV